MLRKNIILVAGDYKIADTLFESLFSILEPVEGNLWNNKPIND